MTIPDYQSTMRPLLVFASDGQEKDISEAILSLGREFHLSDEEFSQLLPSGKQTIFSNRVHWARTYLDKAGAVQRTRRSHFVITQRGRDLLAAHPERIDAKILRQFPEFVAFQTPRSDEQNGSPIEPETAFTATESSPSTPEEALQLAEATISAALREQLLDRIRELPPSFFERLVVDLIVAMGYGGTRDSVVQRLGRSGDEGIDGIVNEHPLGLDVVYIQAKRYAPDNTIGRERIQQFAGALVGQGASKGVFVTTSQFSRGAVEYAQRVPQRIILLDGPELTRLMMRYGVGVRIERVVEIKRIDADYFSEAEA